MLESTKVKVLERIKLNNLIDPCDSMIESIADDFSDIEYDNEQEYIEFQEEIGDLISKTSYKTVSEWVEDNDDIEHELRDTDGNLFNANIHVADDGDEDYDIIVGDFCRICSDDKLRCDVANHYYDQIQNLILK